MKNLILIVFTLIIMCSCKKESLRLSNDNSPIENIIGKWQIVNQNPNNWYWYFREDQTHFTPARLSSGDGYYYTINDSVFTIYNSSNSTSEQHSYRCFGDSLIVGSTGYSIIIKPNGTTEYIPYYIESKYFRYKGR